MTAEKSTGDGNAPRAFRETWKERLGLPLVVERAWGAEVTHV